MGVIRECGGKMHMGESGCFINCIPYILPCSLILNSSTPYVKTEEWDKAQTDFFESFRNYDEAGSPQRIQVLKYVLASLNSLCNIAQSKTFHFSFQVSSISKYVDRITNKSF